MTRPIADSSQRQRNAFARRAVRLSSRWVLGLAVALSSGSLYAEELGNTDKQAAAQVLFDEARKLTEAGDFTSACPKLAESHRLDPAIGTKFYLAECLEKIGKIASAWSYYVEVTDAARVAGQKEREAYAKERAERLKPKLPSMVISVPEATRGLEGLVIKRDGIVVGDAQWGATVPVDPGEHVISATATNKKPWEKRIEPIKEGEALTVDVPLLEDIKSTAPVIPKPVPTSSGKTQRFVGIALGAVGAVGIGLGTFFGFKAMGKQDDSNANGHCDAMNRCDDVGLALRGEAIDAATISTVAFIAGGVAIAGGAVVFLTAPSQARVGHSRLHGPSTRAAIVVRPGGLSITGRF